VIDHLHDHGHGERFILAGISSGAYWSLNHLREDERVVGAAVVNCSALRWNSSMIRVTGCASATAPPSNSARAFGCTFPRSATRFVSSTVLRTRAGTRFVCSAADCAAVVCAPACKQESASSELPTNTPRPKPVL